MQQTLFAVVAVAAFAYLAANRQTTSHRLDQRDATVLLELAAVDQAQARLDAVLALAFDEGDVADGRVRRTPSAIPLGRDAGEAAPSSFDDLDDWHGYAGRVDVPAGRGALRFVETVTVRYVEDDRIGTAAPGPTLSKEVVVTVSEVPPKGAGRPSARASLRRVITPVGLAIEQSTR